MYDATDEQLEVLRDIFGEYGINGLARACAKMLERQVSKEEDPFSKRLLSDAAKRFAAIENNRNPLD